VRAVDPLTRGALRERMQRVASAVYLRSFLDPPTPPGHTIKGSGLVSYKASRFNTTTMPMDFTLQRACEMHMQSIGVQGSDYNFGSITVLDKTAVVSINGRRYASIKYL
jgi:hypothetical protein